MITEFVSEKLVKRRFEGKAVAVFAAEIIGLVLLILAALIVPFKYDFRLSMLTIMLVPLFIYLMTRVVKSTKVEYEYCFFNCTLTVDKIINMENRRHLFDLDVSKVEKAGEFDKDTFNMHGVDFLGNYTASDAMDNAYFLQYKGESGKTNVIVLEKDDPEKNDKILESMRRYIPQTVYREGFRKQ